MKSLIGISIGVLFHEGGARIGPVSWQLISMAGRLRASFASVSACSLKKSPSCALTLISSTLSFLLCIVSIILIQMFQLITLSSFLLVNLGWGVEICEKCLY